ncbi:MAG TPA: tetratricopeptide repeat protein [Terriglobales bacterium]
MDNSKPTRFRFGPFELDVDTSEVFESGHPSPLQSKPLQFLATLLQRHGELVTREQMSHVLWPDIYVQVNQGLNAAARKVRIALHDEVSSPKYFETLGSKGYKFIHPVEILRWSHELPTAGETGIRIAVLPFESNDGGPNGKGLTAELIGLLGRVHPRIRVIAPSTMLQWTAETDPRAFAAELGAEYALTGKVHRDRGKLSVRSQFTDVRTGQTKVERHVEKPLSELCNIVEDLAREVVETLQPGFIPQGATPPECSKTKTSCYMDYLDAKEAWNCRSGAELNNVLTELRRIANSDPGFAPAHAGVAITLVRLANLELAAPRAAYHSALQAAEKALELCPDMPDALVAAAWATLAVDHDWAAATRMYERVLRANPSHVLAYTGYGLLLLSRGRSDDAVRMMERAADLDPLSPNTVSALATAYYYVRRYDDAVRLARRTLELQENHPVGHAVLGISLLMQRRFSDAMQSLESAFSHSGGDPVMEAHLAHAYARSGNISGAQQILTRLENRNGNLPRPSFHISLIRLALNDVTGALRWLELACQERFQRTLFLSVDPRLDVLRGTKQFEELCRQVREPDLRRVNSGRLSSRGGAA